MRREPLAQAFDSLAAPLLEALEEREIGSSCGVGHYASLP
jgi:hypothetical protein